MSSRPWDVRLKRVTWEPVPSGWSVRTRVRLLIIVGVPCAVWYFGWLLQPDRVGTPVLYGILIAAELFNFSQALGFWWTVSHERVREKRAPTQRVAVDVFIPVYKEPPEIVDLTVAAAVGLRGADVRVWVLDDGNDDAMRDLAAGYGVGYIRRAEHTGAKAGNINHALAKTSAPFIAVFDSDHVADPGFLEATLGWMEDPKIAFVQTPQYYANTEHNRIAAASWAQQALFFGAICRGKDGLGAVFCCGTNVLFRREAFESVGGFPTNSLTEDFELSIHLHEKGWSSAYIPDVLSRGLGPEDTAAYVSQQQRWARGCLSGLPRALRAKLPLGLKVQYLLSGLYFLSGWTVLIYMTFPVVRLLGGGQPIGNINAPEFLLHFVPYYAVALTVAAVAGAGSYTFGAFALAAANFWIHVLSTIYTVMRKKGSFVVTPKKGADARQPAAVMPALVVIGILLAACAYGLIRNPDSATINNVSFAAVHISILLTGCWAALQKPRAPVSGVVRGCRGRRLRRSMREVLIVVAALALGGLAVLFVAGCGGSGSSASNTSSQGQSQLSPEERAVAAARHFLDRYVTRDGRVSRRDQGNDTVGEGQAYGMLIAAAIGDERRFNTIWTWTKNNIRRPDGLISFHWQNGHVVDPQAASDADVDATRALLVASCRFNRPSYRHEALQLASAIMRIEVGSATFGGDPVLTAGPWAITPPPITVDPSYFAPKSFLALRTAAKDPRWGALAASSRAITGKLMPRDGRLPPDWAHLEGDTPVPIGNPSDRTIPVLFGFDAVRTLVRFAEDPNPAGRAIAARAWPVFKNADPANLTVEHTLSGQPIGHTKHPVVLVAAAGAADAAGQSAARDGLLDEAEVLDQHAGTYYGAAWVALGRLMLTTKLLDVTCS